MDWGKKWLVDFNAGKTQLVSFDWSNNNGSIHVKMDGSVLEKKSSFKIPGLTFSSKLDCGSHITLSIYMEYCCHIWAGAPSCYLELIDKLQN